MEHDGWDSSTGRHRIVKFPKEVETFHRGSMDHDLVIHEGMPQHWAPRDSKEIITEEQGAGGKGLVTRRPPMQSFLDGIHTILGFVLWLLMVGSLIILGVVSTDSMAALALPDVHSAMQELMGQWRLALALVLSILVLLLGLALLPTWFMNLAIGSIVGFGIVHYLGPAYFVEQYTSLGGLSGPWNGLLVFGLAIPIAGLLYLAFREQRRWSEFLPFALLVGICVWPAAAVYRNFQPQLTSGEEDFSTLSWQLYGYGNREFDAGDLDRALTAYRSSAVISPGLAAGYAGMGHTLISKQDYPGAERAYTRAIASDENHTGAYLGRGFVRWFGGDLQGAEGDYRAVVALDPSLLHYLELEKVLLEQGHYQELMGMWKEAVNILFPDEHIDPGVLSSLYNAMYLAEAWTELVQLIESRAPLEHFWEYYYYGSALNNIRQHQRAVEPLRLALEGLRQTAARDQGFCVNLRAYWEELYYAYVWSGALDEAARRSQKENTIFRTEGCS